MATAITDEQYGKFCAVNDDFRRRVREGAIPVDNAIEIVRRAIRGHGYLGNQIVEGDDIKIALTALERLYSGEVKNLEAIKLLNTIASIGNRTHLVPATYRIVASIILIAKHEATDSEGKEIRQYRGVFFTSYPTPERKGIVFTYEHSSTEIKVLFPCVSPDAVPKGTGELIRKILDRANQPFKVHSTLLLMLSGTVLHDLS